MSTPNGAMRLLRFSLTDRAAARWAQALILALVLAPTAADAQPRRRMAQVQTQPPAPAVTVAYDAEIAGSEAATTLRIRLSRTIEASAFSLERPDRVIIDLPEVNFQLRDDAAAKPAGLVKSFRFGLFSAGRSRIVIDLAQPASVEAAVEAAGAEGQAVLVISLARADRAAFARMAREPQRTASISPASREASPSVTDSRPLLVIDPGHGGVDPGARARNGMLEKTIVFDVAKAVREKLAATGRYRVAMTRDEDVFVSLSGRVKFARRSQADLMISLHADALSADDGVRGASIYTGSDRASDAYAARLAESENRADAAAGADSATELIDDVNDILMDLTRRETRAFSHRFAQALAGGLKGALPMHKTPLKSAGFRVLMAPDVPSVLLELGYLTNTRDITNLTSAEGQAKAGDAIVAAIDAYFARKARP